MRVSYLFRYWLTSALVLLPALATLGQTPSGYRPAAAATAGPSPAILAAQQEVQRAKAALKDAGDNLERYNKAAKAELAKDPQWVEASTALDAARAEKDRVHRDALDKLHDSDGYKQQQSKLKDAQAVIDNQNATLSAVSSATSDAIDARLAMARMESDATKKSPEVLDADAKYEGAQATVNNQFEDYKARQLPTNQPWQAALSGQAKAQSDLDAAQQQLVEARQAAAAQYAQTASATMRPSTPSSYRGSGSSRSGNRSSGSSYNSGSSRSRSSGSRTGY